jgi:hypothetical protein
MHLESENARQNEERQQNEADVPHFRTLMILPSIYPSPILSQRRSVFSFNVKCYENTHFENEENAFSLLKQRLNGENSARKALRTPKAVQVERRCRQQ